MISHHLILKPRLYWPTSLISLASKIPALTTNHICRMDRNAKILATVGFLGAAYYNFFRIILLTEFARLLWPKSDQFHLSAIESIFDRSRLARTFKSHHLRPVRNSIMSDSMNEVTWGSLPNKDQLFVLVVARFSEPVVRTSILVRRRFFRRHLPLCP